MRCQNKLESEKKQIYSISASRPVTYEPELSHSSQGNFFCYSSIDAYPVTCEPGSTPVFVTHLVSAHFELPGKMDLTMKKPDAYLRCTGRYSRSSEIPQ